MNRRQAEDDLHSRRRMLRHLAGQGRRPFDQRSDAAVPSELRPHRRWSSWQLHRLGRLASHAWAGLVVAVVAVGWVAYGAATGFPSYWQTVLESVTSIVTVVLLFAIQHLQAREQTVIQRKLDEILRSLPRADSQVIALEEAPDEEIDARIEMNRRDRLG